MVSGSFRMSGSRRTKMTEDFAARWKKVDADGIGLDSSLDWYEIGERAYASFQTSSEFVRIITLVVPENLRGRGRGRRAMREILSRADEVAVTLKVEVAPLDSGAEMDPFDLAEWYERCGFVPRKRESPDIMFREPGTELQNQRD